MSSPELATSKTPLVIDCDPGVDDAISLALAVGSPELDLRAVTTVAGNVALEHTTANALRVLQLLGRDDVPVAAGARRALVRRPVPHPPVHGDNGLGGVRVEATREDARPEHAVALIAAVLRDAAPRSVTIAAIGPLTNIALLLSLHPELAGRIDRLVIMGGAIGPGNVTPVAEFNIWADPEAAHRVLTAQDVDICLVGLDVTRRATVDEPMLAALRARSHRGSLLASMIDGYGDGGPDGWRMHDALALGAIVDPSLLETRPAFVAVDTGSGLGRAQTLCAFDMPLEGWGGHGFPVQVPAIPPRLQVAVDLDVGRFRELLADRVAVAVSSAAC